MRRSCLSSTVAATRPTLEPLFTARNEIAPALHPELVEQAFIFVERVAGEEEADRVVFALQPL